MAKAVVHVLIATAILFFIVQSPFNLQREEPPKARLHRRLGYKLRERAPTFDPLVIKIEVPVEDGGDKRKIEGVREPLRSLFNLDKATTLASEVAETYQYLTAAGKLNTTLRLIILYPLLDRTPKDGVVSFNELEAWITQRAVERLDYVTRAELESKDKNGDLAISFNEYLPHFSDKDIQKKEMGHGEAGWWQERFDIADTDHDGLLNFSELRDFLHPEDSKNEEILKWMLRDRLKYRRMNENGGKLNFKEFEDHVYKTYESYMDFETNGGEIPAPMEKFAELDVNKDQLLSEEELIPILQYLYPGELAYAKYFTCYLMNEADDDGSGELSLQEMLNHESIFYNTVHADGHQESDDDHDEL